MKVQCILCERMFETYAPALIYSCKKDDCQHLYEARKAEEAKEAARNRSAMFRVAGNRDIGNIFHR